MIVAFQDKCNSCYSNSIRICKFGPFSLLVDISGEMNLIWVFDASQLAHSHAPVVATAVQHQLPIIAAKT